MQFRNDYFRLLVHSIQKLWPKLLLVLSYERRQRRTQKYAFTSLRIASTMQVSRNECRQCRMVPAMAVQTRAEGSVPALLQPPGGPTLPCKALLCPCGTPRGGSPRPAACWGALHHTGQVQPLV